MISYIASPHVYLPFTNISLRSQTQIIINISYIFFPTNNLELYIINKAK